jgi:hypothetical protein
MISHEYNGRYGEKGSTTLLFFKKIKMAHNLQRNTEELNSTVKFAGWTCSNLDHEC